MLFSVSSLLYRTDKQCNYQMVNISRDCVLIILKQINKDLFINRMKPSVSVFQ